MARHDIDADELDEREYYGEMLGYQTTSRNRTRWIVITACVVLGGLFVVPLLLSLLGLLEK